LLYEELKGGRGLKVERLNGDEVRQNLSKRLGFSKEDRDTNIRRIGYVCSLLARNEVIAIAAAISPYRAIRDENRALIGADRFVEVHVHVPLVVAIQRDTKGLYEKAIRGEIKEFTGVSDPYEPPLAPEVYVDTSQENACAELRQDQRLPGRVRLHCARSTPRAGLAIAEISVALDLSHPPM
jgi:adenylyl-sulfate kinase